MARTGRTFRAFVSSTFSDLKLERNALQERVFPKLKELCLSHGCWFQAIDLRWGVSQEAGLDQKTMEICLAEIGRCQKVSPRPNFIVLLGDRYGWRPLPYEIPADEFEEIERRAAGHPAYPLLATWYRRDDNAVPPVYVLQPRKEGTPWADQEVWDREVEKPLVSLFEKAIDGMGLSREAELKYTASATEQEIHAGALRVSNASENVLCCFREIDNLDELERDAVADERARQYVDVCVEDQISPPSQPSPLKGEGVSPEKSSLSSGPGRMRVDPDARLRLRALKEDRLAKSIPANIFRYKGHWESGSWEVSSELDFLCETVYDRVSKVLLDEIELIEEVSQLDVEIEAHQDFAAERRRFFTGRESYLKRIQTYLEASEPTPLALHGASGTGKSALMAEAARRAKESFGTSYLMLRFIGSTPDSSDGRSLLDSLCRELSQVYGADASDIPMEYEKLVEEFPKRLALAMPERPVVIFIDALDQLFGTNNVRSLTWLPATLPPHVHLIVSTMPGECLNALESKLPASSLLKLDPMPSSDGKVLLEHWLKAMGRTLQSAQYQEVMRKFESCGLPLYLKLAFEEARLWRSFDGVPDLGTDVPGILENLFDRLSDPANHGPLLVSRALGYLHCARKGLTEDELLEVLGQQDRDYFEYFRQHAHQALPETALATRTVPVAIWSRLYHDLQPYLTEHSGDGTSLLGFYHRQFRDGVDRQFVEGDARQERHATLARYFGSKPYWLGDPKENKPNLRKGSEVALQQARALLWQDYERTLTAYDFIRSRLIGAGIQPLIQDYDLHAVEDAAGRAPRLSNERSLQLIQGVLRLSSHALSQDPSQLPSQLHGRLLSFTDPVIQKLLQDAKDMTKTPWLRPLTQSLTAPGDPLILTLVGHLSWVNAVSVTPDGKHAVSGSEDKTLKVWDLESGEEIYTFVGHWAGVGAVSVTPDGRHAVSGSRDRTLGVWDLDCGELIHILKGHRDGVSAVSVTPDSKHAVSGSEDKTLKVWDLKSGLEILTLNGHSDRVSAVSVTPDGRHVVSGSEDKTLKVWDLKTGYCIRTLAGHTDAVSACTVFRDGKRAMSASWDKTLKVWNLESGEVIHTLRGYSNGVLAVSVVEGGKRVVSGSDEGALKVWDLESAKVIQILKGHSANVGAVSVTEDGKRAVSGSWDKTLKVWDFRSGVEIQTLNGHSDRVSAVSVTEDGKRAISGSWDKTLKVWDLENGEEIHTLKGHSDSVLAVSVVEGGKRVVSGSNDGAIKVWDLKNGEEIHTLKGHSASVLAVSVSEGGNLAVSSSLIWNLGVREPSSVIWGLKVWDLKSGEEIHTLKGHLHSVGAVSVTENGKRAVSGSWDASLKVWDLDSGAAIHTLRGHSAGITALSLTEDGRRIVSGSWDASLKVWDLESGEEIHTLKGHSAGITALSLTEDGRRIVSGSWDKTLKVWDLESGAEIHTLRGHSAGVVAVSVTEEGKHAISRSHDNTLKVWDLETAEYMLGLEFDSPITCSTIAPDGKNVVAGGSLGHMYFLHVEEGSKSSNLSGPRIAHSIGRALREGIGSVPMRQAGTKPAGSQEECTS